MLVTNLVRYLLAWPEFKFRLLCIFRVSPHQHLLDDAMPHWLNNLFCSLLGLPTKIYTNTDWRPSTQCHISDWVRCFLPQENLNQRAIYFVDR